MIKFGDALKKFRENRGLSLRELGTLSGIDHAYIHRLESGDKSKPSQNVIESLNRSLKLSTQRRQLLNALLEISEIPNALFEAILQKETRSIDGLKIACSMSLRGKRPTSVEEWEKQLDFIDIEILQNRSE